MANSEVSTALGRWNIIFYSHCSIIFLTTDSGNENFQRQVYCDFAFIQNTPRFFLTPSANPHAFPLVPPKHNILSAATEGSRNRTQYFAVCEVEVVIHLHSERLLPQTTEVDDPIFASSMLYITHSEYPFTSIICL